MSCDAGRGLTQALDHFRAPTASPEGSVKLGGIPQYLDERAPGSFSSEMKQGIKVKGALSQISGIGVSHWGR